ncbi:hypothetical protein GIB67_003358 [Kingdonia uniflora]|uniref:Beta-glucosidase n=1 Tax=Kingdonia uniflora TaxID=39325 RepID=A0A7J7P951_9MAGN|nr:hypothetical protein GIB67_003358 [Kingdonia uniflora]
MESKVLEIECPRNPNSLDLVTIQMEWSCTLCQVSTSSEIEGKVHWKGVAYYNRLIDYLLEKGITPYANLYYYNLPEALEPQCNRLLSRRVVKAYVDYADFCFKTYGDSVKNWMTFNEPRVIVALGYEFGFFAPGRCSQPNGNCTTGDSTTKPYIVGHYLIIMHASAIQRYRHKYQV